MYNIQYFNNISDVGLRRFDEERYHVSDTNANSDGIILRSHKLKNEEVVDTVKIIARAGAGVNNIPIDTMSERGVVVVNTPGANANAVKELAIGVMIAVSRNLFSAYRYTNELTADGDELNKQVEAGKKRFGGIELVGKTIGVIGLGAIGREVAHAAMALGMNAVGYDPALTVDNAWKLSAQIKRVNSVDDVIALCDFVTVHVPLNEHTRGLIGAPQIAKARKGVTILNLARGGIIDDEAVLHGLNTGQVKHYVTDFPTAALRGQVGVVALPHLGASTVEAEDNCAIMAVDQMKDFIQHGIIRNSVNFPDMDFARSTPHRVVIAHRNVPNMLTQISSCLGVEGLNINDMFNRSRGDYAFTVVDSDTEIPDVVMQRVRQVGDILRARRVSKIIC